MKSHLVMLRDRYGCNVCGEGGEYETIVLDCPFFRLGRIEIEQATIMKESGTGDIAPSGVISVQSFHIQSKGEANENDSHIFVVPSEFEIAQDHAKTELAFDASKKYRDLVSLRVTDAGNFIQFQLTLSDASTMMQDPRGTQHCLRLQLETLKEAVADRQLSFDQTVFVHLLLKDMRHFAAANEIYCQFFPSVNPPSRACIEVALQVPCELCVLMHESASDHSSERKVLHVQSISAWAPCCIGPYSQATTLGNIIFMAGQLGLDPLSMRFNGMSWQQEVSLALKHCQSVAIAVGADMRRSAIKIAVYLSEKFVSGLAEMDKQLLESLFESHWPATAQHRSEVNLEDSWENVEDEYLKTRPFDFEIRPIFSFITVPTLPKQANVKIQPILVNENCVEEEAERQAGALTVDPCMFPDCQFSKEEWSSKRFNLHVSGMTVDVESDKFAFSPTARVLMDQSGLMLVQIQIPQLLDPASSKSAERLAETFQRLVTCCLSNCGSRARSVLSATFWYNNDHLNLQLSQAVIGRISSETDVSHIPQIEWSCRPSRGIGLDLRLSDLILMDLWILEDYK